MYLDSIMIDGRTRRGQISTEEVMFDILLTFRYFLFCESFNDLVKVSFTGVLIQRLFSCSPHVLLLQDFSTSSNRPTLKRIHEVWMHKTLQNNVWTRQSKQCGFSIYTLDNLKSKSMVRLVRAEKMVLSGLVFARKIARMILIQNI